MSPGQTSARKPVIGIVGGIGSGKSFVARQFEKLGCGVIDADKLARQALADPVVRDTIVQWWGPGMLDAQGAIDRKAVGAKVFDDAAALERLEGLIHPRVHEGRARCRAELERDASIVAIVEDTPLLMEKGLDGACDVIVYVEASRENRLRRVSQRGWDESELARREKKQCALDRKAARADYVVNNDADEPQCLVQVRRVLSQILHTKM